jgi:hypothetical protein
LHRTLNLRKSAYCFLKSGAPCAFDAQYSYMEILEIRTLRGPNYWSGYWKKLIIMRLDIGDYEQRPSDKIEGFYGRMNEVMPSLLSHGCSYRRRGRLSCAACRKGPGRATHRAFRA